MPRASTRRQLPQRLRDPHLDPDRAEQRRRALAKAEAAQPVEAAAEPEPLSPAAPEPAAAGPSHEIPVEVPEVDEYEARLQRMSRILRVPVEFLREATPAQRRALRGRPSFGELLRRNARSQPRTSGWGMAASIHDLTHLHRR
ncbi:MAG: hypothetical protein VKI83_06620 [Synechococcaceae cyanobacterium]|nr:hypothetical protein [Synechococcaceae cyanobacterium]